MGDGYPLIYLNGNYINILPNSIYNLKKLAPVEFKNWKQIEEEEHRQEIEEQKETNDKISNTIVLIIMIPVIVIILTIVCLRGCLSNLCKKDVSKQ
ncbi:hypothetical protein PIROE2DRAFT_10380 [Piromyces sp. E2]|nr:hypothetical protein PIROE2DRAFT_10380 [Piromyces sp. E2]|eukprot:OUM63161.1 hypothetical protein PIROE2DRAFT_10380 [Piromyces sp. E2]